MSQCKTKGTKLVHEQHLKTNYNEFGIYNYDPKQLNEVIIILNVVRNENTTLVYEHI